MAAIARKRSEMTEGARNALNKLDTALADILKIKSDSVPDNMRDHRSDDTSFKFLLKKITPKRKKEVDNRSISCKFEKKELTEANDERLIAIIAMEGQASNSEPLGYHPNEVELYKREVEFVCKLIEWGALSKEDFKIDE